MNAPDSLQLAPGVRRLRPDDHFMILSETDASPMHVGALIILDVPLDAQEGLAAVLRRQLADRLPATPLLVRLHEAPDGYDSDVWADIARADLETLVAVEPHDGAWSEAELYEVVASLNMRRLDLSGPPFAAHVFEQLTAGGSAIYLKVHHSVADGIGFQAILGLLSDAAPPATARFADARLPEPEKWCQRAEARFAAEADLRAAQAARRKEALAALEAFKDDREPTPELRMSGLTSDRRRYTTISLPLARVKAAGAKLDATVNDIFLTLASTALRNYLIEIDDLPATPLVVNSARSYRRDTHGMFGNRIVALHPHLATHLPDPVERLRAIQASMASEMQRTGHDEALLDAAEKPFGARDRRAAFAERMAGGKRLLPGNLTLSNVPGPAEARSYAGFRQLHNYPVPIIGSGRFLNITSRRSGDNLDMGVIADAAKITDVGRIAALFTAALDELESLA
ncbi:MULTISPECIES: wax ester/triacylglycerol synthase domain-containing protein [unclassified Sphingopyxis]|uniref:wax ester/triacylglycerol synthase domain-containing protein n=1 Tax=unclassified Sphingopyxis TaxID=2614943 RepID=UPI0024AE469F|nr:MULTISPECIES: wax ester/triacylglycerol synthase domain-containing protein [unclassified Sphingopyxis]